MPYVQPWRPSSWRASSMTRPSVHTTRNSWRPRKLRKPTTMQSGAHSIRPKRSRQKRQDRDNEGGLFDDRRGGFLRNAHRAPGGVQTRTQCTLRPTASVPPHAEVTERTATGCRVRLHGNSTVRRSAGRRTGIHAGYIHETESRSVLFAIPREHAETSRWLFCMGSFQFLRLA